MADWHPGDDQIVVVRGPKPGGAGGHDEMAAIEVGFHGATVTASASGVFQSLKI